jgi:glyoxylase-like metal-dependent hydrolase (beta-lactamase superfamily II)
LIENALEKGQRPDDEDWEGNSPAHLAVLGNQIESLEYLIESGADLGVKDKRDQTPLDLAIERDRTEIVEYLKKKGCKETPVAAPDIVRLADNVRRITFPFHMKTNIVVQTGPDGIILVDTGFSKRAVSRLRKEIASVQEGDITILINTHEHWDHIAGNFIAGESTVKISGGTIEEAETGGTASRVNEPIAGRTGRSFEYYYSTRFNGEEIRIIPYPGIHSGSDMLIHFTGSGVVHMGDLLLAQSFPAVGDVPRYLEFLDIVLDVFPEETTFVSGHGKDLTRAGVEEYRKMLQTTVDIVRNEISKGKTLEEINEKNVLVDFESYGEFLTFLNTTSWSRAIYRSYSE